MVAASGWGSHEGRPRTEQAGFDHHLVEPFDLARLAELIDSVRARKPGIG
jgi:hypothetical protein